jgi:hypothetical protein
MPLDEDLENLEGKKTEGEPKQKPALKIDGNLVFTIKLCLQEHTVALQDSKQAASMYLIEVKAESSLRKDFLDTYEPDLDDFKRQLAEKEIPDDQAEQTYGVLINTDLQYVYAFNRKFADIDRKVEKITFKNVEDVLIEMTKGSDLSETDVDVPPPIMWGNSGGDLSNTTFRYSVTGKKDQGIEVKGAIEFEK